MNEFLGRSPDDIMKTLGDPKSGYSSWTGGVFYLDYDGIAFGYVMGGQPEEITSIRLEPGKATIDGLSLDRNRLELVGILGKAEWEGWADDREGVYMVQYHDGSHLIVFEMSDIDEKANSIAIN